MSQEFSFKLNFDDFDRSLLGNPPPTVGTDDFKSKLTDKVVTPFAVANGETQELH